MLDYNVYEDIAARNGGDIYIGVVGPVRTGKSTLIKKFMTELVIPNVEDGNDKNLMVDELPQSASGKSIMTTEPKFVPAKAVKVKIEKAVANVRFADCVGFITKGANGFEEDGKPRLVNTPWSDKPLPFAEAAELGTDKGYFRTLHNRRACDDGRLNRRYSPRRLRQRGRAYGCKA